MSGRRCGARVSLIRLGFHRLAAERRRRASGAGRVGLLDATSLVQDRGVTPEHVAQLEAHVAALQDENQALRHELALVQQRAELAARTRATLLRGGGRLLVPLLDRQKVVRSFAKLAETVGDFAGPMDRWPSRDQVLVAAREFMESCVRFAIRQRMLLAFFSLVAASIPFIQIWLVVQQNQIIENQNEFAKIQVYDVVSRSMTEGDRNARLMTGALLSNADPAFLRGVIEEAFNPELAGTYRPEGVQAATRRLEDAAFRGHLARAVVRGVENREATQDADALFEQNQPMFRRILADAESRVVAILVLGEGDDPVDGALAEQVDNYLVQVGAVARTYGRLARTVGEEAAFHADLRPLLERVSHVSITGNRFREAYRSALERLLFEVALQTELGEQTLDFSAAGITPEQALQQGLDRLRGAMKESDVRWDALAAQVDAQ